MRQDSMILTALIARNSRAWLSEFHRAVAEFEIEAMNYRAGTSRSSPARYGL